MQQVVPEVFAQNPPESSQVWMRQIEFRKGSSYLIEAESGQGKSSLCGYLYGYRKDYSGTILFDNTDIRSLTKNQWSRLRCNSLAMMLQDLRLFPELSAIENVELKNHLTTFKSREEIIALFGQMGIPDKVDAPVGKLSFGQQQRVAFIRMLCQPADFMLLDEPVSHLDDRNARTMCAILFEQARAQGCGIITTSIGKHFDVTFDKTYAL